MRLITMILLLLMTLPLLAKEAGLGTVTATKVEGPILYRAPYSPRLRPLAVGATIPEGSLIEVEGVGKLEYAITFPDGSKWRGKQDYLSFKKPITFRIDRHLLRDVTINETYLETLTRKDADKSAQPGQKEFKDKFTSLKLAWEKMAMFIVKKPSTSNFISELYQSAHKEVEVGLKAKRIKLIKPSHGGAHYSLKYPTEMRVLWERPATYRGKFLLYVWPATGVKEKPTAETDLEHYYLQVTEPGSFYLQIASIDDRYLSRPHLVHFGGNFPAYRYARENNLPEFAPKFPLDGQDIVIPGKSYEINFSWQNRWIDSVTKTHLIIEKWQRQKVQLGTPENPKHRLRWRWGEFRDLQIPYGSNHAKTVLKPGRYRWHLHAEYSEKNFTDESIDGVSQSSRKVFRIRRSPREVDLADIIENNLRGSRRFHRLYLAGGFQTSQSR